MPSVSMPMKPSRILMPVEITLQIHQVGEDVENEDGALILGIEIVVEGHRFPCGLHDFGVVAFVFHDHRTQIIRIGQVAHRAVGNVDVLVDVVVPVLNLMLHHAHDLVGNAVEADAVAERILPGK